MAMNNRGWLRILESFIGVMILAGVIVFVYSNNVKTEDISDQAYKIQEAFLEEVAINNTLRIAVLQGNEILLNDSAKNFIPSIFGYAIKVCSIEDNGCRINYIEKELYVKDRIIVSNLTLYSPKKVRLFLWEK